MKLQAYYGECFAGTRHLGAAGRLSNKAVQRVMVQLERANLITRARMKRERGVKDRRGREIGGTLGTYRVDWRDLWAAAANIIRQWRPRWRALRPWAGDVLAQVERFLEWFGRADEWVWDPGGG